MSNSVTPGKISDGSMSLDVDRVLDQVTPGQYAAILTVGVTRPTANSGLHQKMWLTAAHLRELVQLLGGAPDTGGIIPDDMIANVGDRGYPLSAEQVAALTDQPPTDPPNKMNLHFLDLGDPGRTCEVWFTDPYDGTAMLVADRRNHDGTSVTVQLLFSRDQWSQLTQPPTDSFWSAWTAMMAGEVRIDPEGGACRVRNGKLEWASFVAQDTWHAIDDVSLSWIHGKWRIPPPVEPARYEFAEALRLYQEQGAEHIRHRDGTQARVIWNELQMRSPGDHGWRGEAFPAHYFVDAAAADWEIVPKDGTQ